MGLLVLLELLPFGYSIVKTDSSHTPRIARLFICDSEWFLHTSHFHLGRCVPAHVLDVVKW